jgi:hypothetical protein
VIAHDAEELLAAAELGEVVPLIVMLIALLITTVLAIVGLGVTVLLFLLKQH